MSLMLGLTLSCCLAFSWFTNWSVPIERQFPQPIYSFRKIFNPQIIKPKDTYTIVLVGDSMTDYLGSGVEIKKYLKEYYSKKTINIHNFSVGSTNVLTLPDRLQNLTNFNGKISDPIFNTDFDIIIIESFGHNPLSELSLDKGLKKHDEVLGKAREMIKQRQPWALVVLLATIAPHHDRYAEGVHNMPTEEREKWAKERASYIKNHIEYAKKNKLPLINVYEKSLDKDGGG
ncbi:SGNH/GDSL hydrolase family protein, partial [Candidatus Daviesbacteria bacterium]|nr:SGNH/GDSL hydrolase family protein [Candidatus Daviesbacteria bacterium]